MDTKRQVALVTGASGGLGLALARELAKRGYDLVLTARNDAAMQNLARLVRREHGVDVTVQAGDLSRPQGASELVAALDHQGLQPTVVINNAGFGLNEHFEEQDAGRIESMLNLNIIAVTQLSQIYAQRLKANEGGHILLVASLAAYMPAPLMAAYGASKAYVLSLGEALHVELAPKVKVTVLSPGYMETGFDTASGFQPNTGTKRSALPPLTVAQIGLDALFDGKASVVAGKANKVVALMGRLLPRTFMARQLYKSADGRFQAERHVR
jgi:short-subunit dehydrogenase